MKTIQVNSSIPETMAKQIDYFVDGTKFRSRSHFIHCAIARLIDEESNSGKGQMELKPPKKTRRKRK